MNKEKTASPYAKEMAKLEGFKKRIEENHLRYRTGTPAAAVGSTNGGDDEDREKRRLAELRETYETVEREIERELDRFKEFLLDGRTILFKKSYLNKFGVLVVFMDNYLTDIEVRYLKEKVSLLNPISDVKSIFDVRHLN